jgi:phenylacetate-coenzyme A ligase PaaK-like adenylate-forming protein
MKNNSNLIKDLNGLLSAARTSYQAMKTDRLSKFLGKINSISDYQKIPPTTKEDFYDFDLSKKFSYVKRSRLDENGKEPILPLTEDDYWRYVESEVGRFKAMGVKKTDRISVVNFTINETIPIVNSLMKLGATYIVTEGDVNLICDDLIKKEVNVIFTYHRMLEKIIEHLESRSLKLALRLVIVTAEPIDDKNLLKKRVKKVLGADLIDTIGTREIGGYAYECPEKNCYHFLDSLYAETVDPETKAATSKAGELLITPLWRKDLPLIRFATRDLVKLEQKTCSCKVKNNLVFKKVLGRINENVKIGYSMVDLREVYFETKKLINYQYPVIDNLF